MPIRVSVTPSITTIRPCEWNGIVAACGSEAFYSYDLLAAWEKFPLEPHLQQYYLYATDDSTGRGVAALPVFLYEPLDPYGDLAAEVPASVRLSRGLLTHFWHCYDTRLPATGVSGDVISAVCQAMRGLARSLRADWYGFLNVAEGSLLQQLSQGGLQPFRLPERYALDLTGIESFDEWLKLRGKRRYKYKRQCRRAQRAGARVEITGPPIAAIDEIVALCRSTAAKYGFEDYYPAKNLAGFLGLQEQACRIVSVRQDGTLVGAVIAFVERGRIHAWAGGARYDLTDYSPWTVAMLNTIEFAIRSEFRSLEAGRSNGTVKRRYGMQPVPLFALLAAV